MGQKDLGKSTFAYHFINYLLSQNEKKTNILIEDFKINSNNSSFKLIQNNIHPNFFLIENDFTEENIKIEQIRNLLKFLSKSTYAQRFKDSFY